MVPATSTPGIWGKLTEYTWKGRQPEVVLCRAGDVLFFRSELWHSGSDNTTADRVRYLLQIHYGRRWIAQRFSPYLSWQFNPEVLARCTPRQRRLLIEHSEPYQRWYVAERLAHLARTASSEGEAIEAVRRALEASITRGPPVLAPDAAQ